jgi:hypothetical protein
MVTITVFNIKDNMKAKMRSDFEKEKRLSKNKNKIYKQ